MVKTKSKVSERSNKGSSSRADSTRSNDADQAVGSSEIPEQLQQHVLNIFRDALLQDENLELESTIQKVKQHLYNRDFTSAFGTEQNLLAYAARWSSYRALGYLQIFQDISPFITGGDKAVTEEYEVQTGRSGDSQPHVDVVLSAHITSDVLTQSTRTLSITTRRSKTGNADHPPAYDAESNVPAYENPPAYGMNTDLKAAQERSPNPSMTITFLGGGAGAELVASAAWLRLQSELAAETPSSPFGQAPVDEESLQVYCIDIANWSNVVQRLSDAVKTPPMVSKYASTAVKVANAALLPQNTMSTQFLRQDVLEASPDSIRALFQRSDLITIMFTLNELYSASVSKTQRLLFEMTVAASPGTLLLVVDSPGSYSTVKLNNTEKKYPMQWLLDHTLLEASKNTRLLPRGDQWEKLLTDDSRWFRPPRELKYPIELENMRYQIHLYRRLAVSDDPLNAGPSVTKPQR